MWDIQCSNRIQLLFNSCYTLVTHKDGRYKFSSSFAILWFMLIHFDIHCRIIVLKSRLKSTLKYFSQYMYSWDKKLFQGDNFFCNALHQGFLSLTCCGALYRDHQPACLLRYLYLYSESISSYLGTWHCRNAYRKISVCVCANVTFLKIIFYGEIFLTHQFSFI